jgi:hypothetical protein
MMASNPCSSLAFSLLQLCECRESEMDEQESEWECESEWESGLVLWCVLLTSWTVGLTCGAKGAPQVTAQLYSCHVLAGNPSEDDLV